MYAIRYKNEEDKCLSINNWKPTLVSLNNSKIYKERKVAINDMKFHKERLPEGTDMYDYTIVKVVLSFDEKLKTENNDG